MIYDLNNILDKERFKRRCNQLYKADEMVELSAKKKTGTLRCACRDGKHNHRKQKALQGRGFHLVPMQVLRMEGQTIPHCPG